MDKEKIVLDFLNLYELLDKKTQLLMNVVNELGGIENIVLLEDAYQWIFNHFNAPEDNIDTSLPDLFSEKNVKKLTDLLIETY